MKKERKEAIESLLNFLLIYVRTHFGNLKEFAKLHPKEAKAILFLYEELKSDEKTQREKES